MRADLASIMPGSSRHPPSFRAVTTALRWAPARGRGDEGRQADRGLFRAAGALLPLLLAAAPAPKEPPVVRVLFDTQLGPITIAVDTRRAPATSANFLAYVDDRRFDGIVFYRSARARLQPKTGFIQGGIRSDARRILPPFPLETTRQTGLRHLDGTISMARRADPDSAGGNFFITVGPGPSFDAHGTEQGYAAFGHVVAGMPVVRRLLALPTGGGDGPMKNQMLMQTVLVRSARRLDGTPHPTGRPRTWAGIMN